MNKKKMKKSIEILRNSVNISCSDGTWNYSPYLHGMANGLIFALAIFEGEEPCYLAVPDNWEIDSGVYSKIENHRKRSGNQK